jgi:aminoglycoside phosphotransferase family enzyme
MNRGPQFDGRGDPGLAAKVGFLSRRDSYAEAPRAVEMVETHMSWVFLTDRHAYKLKKPVRYEFLDFSTLAARRADCEAEVRLNRRLAPDVYLGMVALTLDRGGGLQLGGPGEPVEWLVKMRRLPAARMLDQRILSGRVQEAELDPAAYLLARFYECAEPVRTEPAAYRKRFEGNILANQRVMLTPEFAMPAALVREVAAVQLEFAAGEPGMLGGRARDGRIVDGHGDLRPEHVYLGPGPAIIDCLEFDRDLRRLDPAEELAFLAMECDLLKAGAVGRRFLEVYREVSGDAPPEALLSFYKCNRACLRCKLSLWHITDPAVADPERWRDKAAQYLALASGYAREIAGQAGA